MRLKNYGYNVTSTARSRHSALGKAVKRVGFGKVKAALQSRKSRANGYKMPRYRADLNWLKKKRNKYY